jgi:hypothetical protein
MAGLTTSNYMFLPWVRQGAASGIATPDSLGADQAGVAATAVSLRVNNAHAITRQVRLYGPGDVTGIDTQQIIRIEPRHLAMDFEPNYFPAIEFDRPDFPWLFTPAKAAADGRLRPWLVLVVVRKQEGVALRTDRTLPLPVLEIKAPAQPGRELPDLAESWAWAHAQVMGSRRETAALEAALAGDPALNVARLLCPRRLDPATEYLACLVPAFDLGRKAGLGLAVEPGDEQRLEPAWRSGAASQVQVALPVYYSWEFRTGTGGDFKALVAQLKPLDPRDLPSRVGKCRVDVSRPGFAITPPPALDAVLELEGALRVAGAPTLGWPEPARVPFQAALKPILEAPWQALQVEPAADPLLAPPIYGCWQAARHVVTLPGGTPDTGHWLDDLNLDPRWRAAAALGTAVVQAQQEQLVAAAWEQLGEIQRINQMRRQAQLARAVNGVYYDSIFTRLPDEAFFRVVAPAQARLVLAAPPANPAASGQQAAAQTRTLFAQAVARSALPAAVVSAPIRRLARPRGAVNRQSVRAGAGSVGRIFRLLNAAAPIMAKFVLPENGAVTAARVSDAITAALQSSGGFVWVPESGGVAGHWERPRATLTKMLELFRLPGIVGSATAIPPPNTPPAFVDAVRTHQAYLNQLFTAALPGPPPSLDIKAGLLASLQPARTLDVCVNTALAGAPFSPLGAASASPAGDALAPIMDAPDFPQPMYTALRDLSQDYLLPGLEHVPPNTVTLLETNPHFVESFLVGLNSEMSSELLWRGYPTDQRGTYFRHFWDRSAGDDQPDIDSIMLWGERALGHNARAAGSLVLLVRGELLRRYPNSVIYAVAAVKKGDQLTLSSDANAERPPLFRGTLDPDVTFLGFDLNPDEAAADPGWFFVIQQQPTEPRFGLKAAQFGAPPAPLSSWNDLSWGHFAPTAADLAALTHIPAAAVLPSIGGAAWGKTAAHQAYITIQRPVRIAIHARQIIKQEAS